MGQYDDEGGGKDVWSSGKIDGKSSVMFVVM